MAHPLPDRRPSSNRCAMLSRRQPVRTMIVAISGGVILALGCGVTAASPADPNFPLGGNERSNEQSVPNQQHEPEKRLEEAPEKAEKLGGGVATTILDLGAGVATTILDLGVTVVKCGLNIVTPSVNCDS